MFRVTANLETAIAYALKYAVPYTVYAVRYNSECSTYFLFYISGEWRWLPAKGFEPEGNYEYYVTR